MFDSLSAYNFILVAINLVILYLVLRWLLFKPVTAFMEKRTQSIQDAIDDAQKQKEQAEELKSSYESQMNDMKLQGEEMIAKATNKANSQADKIMAQAKADADLMIKNAQEQIEQERQKMQQDIHNQVVDLAIEAASKVIEVNMNTAQNIQIVEEFLDEEGAA